MRKARPGDDLAEHLVDVLAPLGDVEANRFFGGHGLSLGGVQLAMVIKGEVYLRADDALAARLAERGSKPFTYRTRARTVRVPSYWSVPQADLDDEDAFVGWARSALAAARAGKKKAKTARSPRRP